MTARARYLPWLLLVLSCRLRCLRSWKFTSSVSGEIWNDRVLSRRWLSDFRRHGSSFCLDFFILFGSSYNYATTSVVRGFGHRDFVCCLSLLEWHFDITLVIFTVCFVSWAQQSRELSEFIFSSLTLLGFWTEISALLYRVVDEVKVCWQVSKQAALPQQGAEEHNSLHKNNGYRCQKIKGKLTPATAST